MASLEPYVSPYAVDERTRRSVMVAQENKSIAEVHERDSRRIATAKYPPFKPEFDADSFSGALATVTVAVEGVCFEGVAGWEVRRLVVSERPRGQGFAPSYLGNDRVTLSLYDPLENLEYIFERFLCGVDAWATKLKYFEEVTRPLIVRTIEHSTSEASTAKKIRKALDYVGPIDEAYVNSFEAFSSSMEEPILELRTLCDFIASILKEGDEISPPEIGHDTPRGKPTPPKSSLSIPSSPFAETLNPATEASGSRRSAETKTASTIPTSSSYFDKILNPEPAAQGPTSGRVEMESTASEHGGASTGFEDLMQAAGYGLGSNKKSPSPAREPEHKPMIDRQYPGSPSYSPPPSPSASVNGLLDHFSAPWIKAEVPSPDDSSSILLQPSPLHQTKPSTAPSGTPQWKIDLSERKGHLVHILHVGPPELNVLARCQSLVHSAIAKGEECVRVITELQDLAPEMEREYKQWDDFCTDLEDNVSTDDKAGKAKRKQWFGHAKKADGTKGTAQPTPFARGGPQSLKIVWGHRPFDAAPSQARNVFLLRGPSSAAGDGYDPDETETDEGDGRGRAGGSQASTVRLGSPMSGVSDSSQGVEVVTNFEEAFHDDGGEGEDQEMVDEVGGEVGGGDDDDDEEEEEEEGEWVEEEEVSKKGGGQLKKGLTTAGGRRIGLYGEDL